MSVLKSKRTESKMEFVNTSETSDKHKTTISGEQDCSILRRGNSFAALVRKTKCNMSFTSGSRTLPSVAL